MITTICAHTSHIRLCRYHAHLIHVKPPGAAHLQLPLPRFSPERPAEVPACYAGRLNLVLGETGEVYPCEMRAGSLGNVRDHDYDLGRILRSATARATLASIRSGRCHCTHECYLMTNILFNPRWYPALIKEYLRLSGRSAG